MKVIESYKIPTGNVSPVIFKLPCIDSVQKGFDGEPIYIGYQKPTKRKCFGAVSGDWLCKCADGTWRCFDDYEYKQIINEL